MKQLNKNFTDSLALIYTKEELKIIESGFNLLERPTIFRLNTLKLSQEELFKILAWLEIEVKAFDSIPNSFSLVSQGDKKKLWNHKILKDGCIYLQSISSQIPVHFFDIKDDMRFLDLAAAPGWKTTQIATILNNTGSIIAIDNNQIRADKLRFTIARQWVKNASIMKIDARSFPSHYSWELFDAMLFDAPCSAEGRINLNNDKTYDFVWPSNNKKNYYLQRDILKANVPLLKEWGQLIYSTCTISPLENEAIVHFLLCNFPELEIVDIDTSILENIPYKSWLTHFGEVAYKKEVSQSIRILPSQTTEWFFNAKFIKK